MHDAATRGLPAWAASVAGRLAFHARGRRHPPGLADTLAALRLRLATGAAVQDAFLHACLDLLIEAAGAHPALAPHRRDLAALCALARTALATDRDDRPLLARTRALMTLPGPAGFAASIPGRVVFLAAMAASLPEEEAPAAAMLADDLAAVDPALPLRALQRAAQPVSP